MGIVTDVILPIALAFIMFALGLGLTFDDFARVAKRPRDFIICLKSPESGATIRKYFDAR